MTMEGNRIVREVTLDAVISNVTAATDWINCELEKLDCPLKVQLQIDMAIDELFSNIAYYAYKPGTGSADIRLECEDRLVSITFIDSGIPFNPLDKPDPDVSLPAEQRRQGGLGIFLVKKAMDAVEYRREDGKNILTIRKHMGQKR